MQVASTTHYAPVAGPSSQPAGSSNRPENDASSKFDALYQQNALAKLRASVIVKSQLFGMSRVTGTPDSASRKGYQLLAELQQSTHGLLEYLSNSADETRSGFDEQLLQRITAEAIDTVRTRVTTRHATREERLREALHEVDTACNKYMMRDAHTAKNFLALHAALNVCIQLFEAAVSQQPPDSAGNPSLEQLYTRIRAAVREGRSNGATQRLLLQRTWDNTQEVATDSRRTGVQETTGPQIQAEEPQAPIEADISPHSPVVADALMPSQQFLAVDRILEEMAQGGTKWNSGTRFTAPTKQLRQLKEMLGRETESLREGRPLRDYILTKLVQTIGGLPSDATFTHEHREMVVRLYQRALHHESLPKHDYFSHFKRYRQLRIVDQLNRLAPTPADFQQHLVISDNSLPTILLALLESEKMGEFRETWHDITGYQLQRLHRNIPVYMELMDRLININSGRWTNREKVRHMRVLEPEIAWLQTQRILGTEARQSEFNSKVDDLVCSYLNQQMLHTYISPIRSLCGAFIESLGRVLDELFLSSPWAYSNLLGNVVNAIRSDLNRWEPDNPQALFNMLISSLSWHQQSHLLEGNMERIQFNDSITTHLKRLMQHVMSETGIPPELEDAQQQQMQFFLAQLQAKFIELRTANLEAHAELLASFMRGWNNWPDWNDDARNTLIDMVLEELRWIDENRRGYVEANPGLDFAHFSRLAVEYTTSLAGQDRIAQIILPPDYVTASSNVGPRRDEADNARAAEPRLVATSNQ